jgi:hypothetical protein
MSSKHRTDIGKYSFVNRTIQLWNQLPVVALGNLSCKPSNFFFLGGGKLKLNSVA